MSDKIVQMPGTVLAEPEGLAATMLGHARLIAEGMPKTMMGFIVIGLDSEGGYRMGWKVDQDHPLLGPTLMRAYFNEIMTRELSTEAQICDFSERHGWIR